LLWSKIEQLAADPHAPNNNVKRLRGESAYRLRVGDWRVLYRLEKARLVILVLKIRPRSSAYD
jgi:mRNA interferase RelE/StbE